MRVKVYQPAKNAMQSGPGRKKWCLEFMEDGTKEIEGVMGWTGSGNMEATEVTLWFESEEEATRYAKHKGWEYVVIQPQLSPPKLQSYSANFQQHL